MADNPGGGPDPDPTATASSTAVATETPTVTMTPSATLTISPTATITGTTTMTPTATASPTPSPEPAVYLSHLPMLIDTPPPSPPGCVPATHLPGVSPHLEDQMAGLINAYRLNADVAPLTVMSPLTQAARRHAADMSENDFVDHGGSDGSSVSDRVSDACYQWAGVGQIIGINDTVTEMFIAWINSNGNRALILSAEYEDFGVGYAYNPDAVQKHSWVVVFGRSAASGIYLDTGD